jgi:hypothetical protein
MEIIIVVVSRGKGGNVLLDNFILALGCFKKGHLLRADRFTTSFFNQFFGEQN